MTEEQAIAFNKKNVYIGKSEKGYGWTHFAQRDFKKGERIVRGFGKVVSRQTSHCSIQIKEKMHIVPTKWTGRYWNHSCNPNAYAKTEFYNFPSLFALRGIKKGEEIAYGYWTTELKWAKKAKENFVKCKCKEKYCKGKIFSFSQLSKKEQQELVKSKQCSSYLY